MVSGQSAATLRPTIAPLNFVFSLPRGAVGKITRGLADSPSGGEEQLWQLNALHRRTAAVACSAPATWVEPKPFSVVGFAGWRPNEAWRDAAFAEWAEELL
jgi:hypothetical protein